MLGTVNVGHKGLPVYTAFCKDSDEEAAGEKLVEVMWTLHQQHAVKLETMAVIVDLHLVTTSYTRKFAKKLTTSFYKSLQTHYIRDTGGQQYSLIPLPLFALDIKTHSQQDLKNALEKQGTWTKTLDEYFNRDQMSEAEGHTIWEDAVRILLSDVYTKSTNISQSPASEKVRSILLHLLQKSCDKMTSKALEGEQGTKGEKKILPPKEIFDDFKRTFRELLEKEKVAQGRVVKRRGKRSLDNRNNMVSDAEALGLLLNRYRFLQFVDVNWIQGCEFDVVVMYSLNKLVNIFEYQLFLSLSRAKLLSVAIIPGKTEEDAAKRWPGPWRDWKEFVQLSSNDP